MLSRNFRLQKVGDLDWLRKNYQFSKVSSSIDELIILNVSRDEKDEEIFIEHIKQLNNECFIPIAAGGGIRTISQARKLLKYGADKVVLNSSLFINKPLVHEIAEEFGQQCIIAAIDIMKYEKKYKIFVNNGQNKIEGEIYLEIKDILSLPIGEVYLNSIDRDGTGQGYLIDLIDLIDEANSTSIIIAGGAGNFQHLFEGLNIDKIDAVATAHLFNFVGNGLYQARKKLIDKKYDLPIWNTEVIKNLKGCLDT
jgi:imidazole glycerol-phosphate synthase subunit HisF